MRIPVRHGRVGVSKHPGVSKENWRPQETHLGRQAGKPKLLKASGELEMIFDFFSWHKTFLV